MRNYFDVLGLQSNTSIDDVHQAIDELSPEQLADQDDLYLVLMDDLCQKHYRRMHLQYEAINAALNTPAMSNADNSHSWDKRTVEFNLEQNTIEL